MNISIWIYLRMFFHSRSQTITACALALLLSLFCASLVRAQADDFGDDAADPIQLFKRAQDFHARGDYAQALSLYDAAIKVRPEFPEAFFQRGTALLSLGRYPEAEKSFQRAIELRDTWALPQAALGALLLRQNRLTEAEKYLESALKIEGGNSMALTALADLRVRTKASRPVLEELLKRLERATSAQDPTPSLWVARASVERALGKLEEAHASLDNALKLDPNNIGAIMERAEMSAAAEDFGNAIGDARRAYRLAPESLNATLFLANMLARAGRAAEALKVLDELESEKQALPEVVEMRKAVAAVSVPQTEDPAAMEKLLEEQPRNSLLLARLCIIYRTSDTTRALEYCRRALEIEPANADYATGYGAALVRAKRFEEAAALLRQVTARVPDNYVAHANLATALYELKRYQEALVEYDWIVKSKPELAVTYFFIATARDQLGQFPEALEAYEKFLERADPKTNQLEIDKVKLRLPSLRNQITRGEGAKRNKGKS